MHLIPLTGSGGRDVGLLAAAVALALVAGCYPGDIEDLSRSDIVATVHDEDADFQSLRTYAVPDTVVDIGAEPGTGIPPSWGDDALAAIHANMEALGYVKKLNPTPDDPPDVVVTCSYTTIDYTVWYYDDWCYWWGWYGYYCGGWGWYPGYDSVTYTAGTLLLNMFDIKNRDPQSERVPMPWAAICSGLISGGAPNATRISEVIDRSFDQSPYLELRAGKTK